FCSLRFLLYLRGQNLVFVKHYILSGCMAAAILFNSCTITEPAKRRGAIVMGDSSTIVTETDAKYLRDVVPDVKPGGTSPESPATENQVSPEHYTEWPNYDAIEERFEIDCRDYHIVLADISANEYQNHIPVTAP